jgi:hypothetical protein
MFVTFLLCSILLCLIFIYIKKRLTKNHFDIQILNIRSDLNELILSSSKRKHFFKNIFGYQYDNEFLKLLHHKVLIIISSINEILPSTQLDQIIEDDFKSINSIIQLEEGDLSLEDDARIQLFLDNLNLHNFYLFEQKYSTTNDDNKNTTGQYSKYLKKIIKILKEWQTTLEDVEDCQMTEDYLYSQPPIVNYILFISILKL